MKRRSFIKKSGLGAAGVFSLNNIPLKLLAGGATRKSEETDKVVVILQLHGGNDGINTFIPVADYSQYVFRRANIAVPYQGGNRTAIDLDNSIAAGRRIALHPDMVDFKYLYEQGQASVVQGVSYPKNNGSHFRGRDIWLMGGGPSDYYASGWIGRYLESYYAPSSYPDDFPNTEMPDPLALEMGNDISLLFHQSDGIPLSLSLGQSPGSLASLVDRLEGFSDSGVDPRGLPPEYLKNTHYGKELDYLLSFEDKTEVYIKQLFKIYESASESSVTYPELYPFYAPGSALRNPLSNQFKLVARLLDGGAKTKVFLLKLGGFDTHADQTTDYDPTLGSHAASLYHISSAIRAFQKDLEARGLADRVLTVTMSEFGRRVASNASFGTDHGTGGPVMLFGKGIAGGVYGDIPDLSKSNVEMQYDYRQVYASILHDWMGMSQNEVNEKIFFGDYINPPNLPSFRINQGPSITGIPEELSSSQKLKAFPNPADRYFTVEMLLPFNESAQLSIFASDGRLMKEFSVEPTEFAGTIRVDCQNFKPGFYFVKLTNRLINESAKVWVRH